ncbi:MAG: Rdx family protein [Acidobacteria bacterium]|nr:Rdx family protein [Acidobacteriota bacterium]
MADHLVRQFKQNIDELTLLPSDGGCFEIKVNDEMIYSKLSTGQFPENLTIEQEIRDRL